jgi:hypothetical protein
MFRFHCFKIQNDEYQYNNKTYLFSVAIVPEALAAVISRAVLGALVRVLDFPTLTASQSCPVGSETFGMVFERRINEVMREIKAAVVVL